MKRALVVLTVVASVAWQIPTAAGADKPIEGGKLFLMDSASPSLRRLQFATSDPSISFGSNADSDTPTVHGASLLVFNPTTSEYQCIILPPENWELGTPSGLRYKYRDRTLASGPVQVALFKAGKVKVIAKGTALSFTLDEMNQGPMSAHYTSGTGNKLCAHFALVRVDRPNLFVATHAAPPGGCQPEPVTCVPPGPSPTTTTTLP
jgi:hypothetical protein